MDSGGNVDENKENQTLCTNSIRSAKRPCFYWKDDQKRKFRFNHGRLLRFVRMHGTSVNFSRHLCVEKVVKFPKTDEIDVRSLVIVGQSLDSSLLLSFRQIAEGSEFQVSTVIHRMFPAPKLVAEIKACGTAPMDFVATAVSRDNQTAVFTLFDGSSLKLSVVSLCLGIGFVLNEWDYCLPWKPDNIQRFILTSGDVVAVNRLQKSTRIVAPVFIKLTRNRNSLPVRHQCIEVLRIFEDLNASSDFLEGCVNVSTGTLMNSFPHRAMDTPNFDDCFVAIHCPDTHQAILSAIGRKVAGKFKYIVVDIKCHIDRLLETTAHLMAFAVVRSSDCNTYYFQLIGCVHLWTPKVVFSVQAVNQMRPLKGSQYSVEYIHNNWNCRPIIADGDFCSFHTANLASNHSVDSIEPNTGGIAYSFEPKPLLSEYPVLDFRSLL